MDLVNKCANAEKKKYDKVKKQVDMLVIKMESKEVRKVRKIRA